jgi:tRNA 5-methylaminomethyl-2-thiouridine biosynthesis bifunctional protein
MHFNPRQPQLPAPNLRWDEGTLISNAYDDVYASRDGSVEETQYVFLNGNGFPERWSESNHFTIAELGFGTGLNFFVAWSDFLRHANSRAHLHFISTELVPLHADDIMRAIANYPELEWLASQFCARMPLRIAGIHTIQFERVTLTLCYGDANEFLPQLNARVDAWFLDGFSPAKNPDMWNQNILTQVARLGGTVATFSAAGDVKRGLEAAGYTMEKRPGFGHKRDMLVGTPARKSASRAHQQIAVIGGGVAGCATAYALARRGHYVNLYESQTIASGASGNPAALLYPRLTKHWSPEMSLYLSAYSYMLSHIPYWNCAHEVASLIKTIKDDQERERFANLKHIIDPSILQFDGEKLIFPNSIWIDPRDLCQKLLRHSHIQVHENHPLDALPAADAVILCNGHEAAKFAPEMKLGKNAGQLSIVPRHHIKEAPYSPRSHKGYVIPGSNNVLIGATYDHNDFSLAVTEENHRKNREEAIAACPDLFADDDMSDWQGRTSLRATTPSRMPYIQKVREGLYINAGHGSRGMLSAPYGGELLANLLDSE